MAIKAIAWIQNFIQPGGQFSILHKDQNQGDVRVS
jgi:hypothetical protein